MLVLAPTEPVGGRSRVTVLPCYISIHGPHSLSKYNIWIWNTIFSGLVIGLD